MTAGQFSGSAVAASTRVLPRDDLRKSLYIANHSASKDLIVKMASDFNAAVTQVQTLSFPVTPDNGAWKVTYDGNESAELAFDDDNSAVETALQALTGMGSATVAGAMPSFVVTMTGVPHIVGNPELMTVTSNTLYRAGQHLVTFSAPPTAGAWKLKIGAFTTAELAFDDDNSAVETAVQALTGLSSATVTGNYSTGFTLNLIGVNFTNSVDVVESTLSTLEIEQVQSITFDAVPDAGQWNITYGENTTGALAYDADAATVQVALRLLEGLESVTVAGDYSAGFDVTMVDFDGDALDLEVDEDTLTESATPVIASVDETTAYAAAASVTDSSAVSVAYAAAPGTSEATTPGNLADVGLVIGEGGSAQLSGSICQSEMYAKSEDSTAVSFEVISG